MGIATLHHPTTASKLFIAQRLQHLRAIRPAAAHFDPHFEKDFSVEEFFHVEASLSGDFFELFTFGTDEPRVGMPLLTRL
jgi:hypothetical protein